jgi:hypothetical protein
MTLEKDAFKPRISLGKIYQDFPDLKSSFEEIPNIADEKMPEFHSRNSSSFTPSQPSRFRKALSSWQASHEEEALENSTMEKSEFESVGESGKSAGLATVKKAQSPAPFQVSTNYSPLKVAESWSITDAYDQPNLDEPSQSIDFRRHSFDFVSNEFSLNSRVASPLLDSHSAQVRHSPSPSSTRSPSLIRAIQTDLIPTDQLKRRLERSEETISKYEQDILSLQAKNEEYLSLQSTLKKELIEMKDRSESLASDCLSAEQERDLLGQEIEQLSSQNEDLLQVLKRRENEMQEVCS